MNDEHIHKYFLFSTKADFVPYDFDSHDETAPNDYVQLYERVEYGILACNCGAVLRSRIHSNNEI